jgi:hypothetical protein
MSLKVFVNDGCIPFYNSEFCLANPQCFEISIRGETDGKEVFNIGTYILYLKTEIRSNIKKFARDVLDGKQAHIILCDHSHPKITSLGIFHNNGILTFRPNTDLTKSNASHITISVYMSDPVTKQSFIELFEGIDELFDKFDKYLDHKDGNNNNSVESDCDCCESD